MTQPENKAVNEGGEKPARGVVLRQVISMAAVGVAGIVLSVSLSGCSFSWLNWMNTESAQALARSEHPKVSLAVGWRVFQDKCAACHGTDATGLPGGGPNLLIRLRGMGHRRFVELVLQRYDWGLPPDQARRKSAAQDALVNDIVVDPQGAATMPAWAGEPVVVAHINDVFAYLAARSEGTLATGRPAD